jgi:hypothetical protein
LVRYLQNFCAVVLYLIDVRKEESEILLVLAAIGAIEVEALATEVDIAILINLWLVALISEIILNKIDNVHSGKI